MAIVYGANYGAPTLDLNFSKNKSLIDTVTGRNLVTFTRSSTATYVGADGLIKSAAANEARFDHNPVTGESLGLLVEEARTNQALYSSDFSNAVWVEAETTKTANASVAPDGTTTAALVVPTSASATHKFRQSVSTADSVLTFSVYLKAAGYTRIALNEQAQIGSSSAIINLTDGSGATSGTTVSNAGNGWYRVSWSSTFGSGGPKVFCVVVLPTGGSGENPNNFTWTANGTSGVYIWGAQLEAGTFPTSYIPTVASTVTRSADVASITGANFSSWYRQDEGTVFCQGISNSTVNSTYWTLQGSSSNGATVLVYPANNLTYQVYENVFQVNSSFASYPAVASVKTAAAIKLNNFAVVSNGGAITSNTSGTVPTVSSFVIGNYLGGGTIFDYSGTIARLTYYPTRLQDFQLQQLTK